MRSEVVYWTRGGRVMHRDPQCPPFVRVARAEMDFISSLGPGERVFDSGTLIGSVRSYDFVNDSAMDDGYPPDRLMPCRLCYRPYTRVVVRGVTVTVAKPV